MKNLIKYIIALIALGSNSVFAQKSSIDSPHNYKRPVFQQRKAMNESNGIVGFSQISSYKFKNNIGSVHNYKRQGLNNFASESAFVLAIPSKNEVVFDPLLSPNNYKAHFITDRKSVV